MMILLVDNDGDTFKELKIFIASLGWKYDIVHGPDMDTTYDATKYDLVILSGGLWYDQEAELNSVYKQELAFIRTTTIPVLGICAGMLLMVRAYGANLISIGRNTGLRTITTTKGNSSVVYENQSIAVDTLPNCFETFATSTIGKEIVKHTNKPQLGLQFHPEITTPSNDGASLFSKLLKMIMAPKSEQSKKSALFTGE